MSEDADNLIINWSESWFQYLEKERAHMAANLHDLALAVDGLLTRVNEQQTTISRLERELDERQREDTLIPETLEKIRQALATLDTEAQNNAAQDHS